MLTSLLSDILILLTILSSHLFTSRLRLVYSSTLKIENDLPIYASYYALLYVHLLLFLSPDWLIFCHMIISYKFTRFFIYFLFLSDEGPMLETLDFTIRIAVLQPFYISICISTLPLFNESVFKENVKIKIDLICGSLCLFLMNY